MKSKVRQLGRVATQIAVTVALLLFGMPLPRVSAATLSCVANVSPHSVTPGSTVEYQLSVSNTGDGSAIWMHVDRPSGNFSVTDASMPGWSASSDETGATLSGGSLSGGQTAIASIGASVVDAELPTSYWSVQISDSPDGTGSVYCDGGDTSTDVSYPPPAVISNIRVTGIGATAATVRWDTSEPAGGHVDYGTTSDYGSSADQSGLSTSHAVSLQGLDPDTGYHYLISSSTADNRTSTSEDNTFITTPTPVAVPPAPTVAPTHSGTSDRTPPTLNVKTKIAGAYKEAPTVSGVASDNEQVAAVAYSVDGGKGWLPAQITKGAGTKSCTFIFTPSQLDDGDYSLIVRAADGSGNTAQTPVSALIIDRLPPKVGAMYLSVGPQEITPQENGVMPVQVGMDEHITLSAVGGPNSVTIKATGSGQSTSQSFNLNKNAESGLWSGIISLNHPGYYDLQVTAVDGAGNITSRSLGTASASFQLAVVDKASRKPVTTATASLYVKDPESGSWVVWDASEYDQVNPQPVRQGGFSFLPPAGTYYLKVTAPGYRTLLTQIMTTDRTKPLSGTLAMLPDFKLNLGPVHFTLPTWQVSDATLDPAASVSARSSHIGSPSVSLTDSQGAAVSNIVYNGKPTAYIFLNSWSPTSSEQLRAVSGLHASDVNIVPVFVQENPGRAGVYVATGGYDVASMYDLDGSATAAYHVATVPSIVFASRSGAVVRQVTGVMSQAAILKQLSEGGL